MVSQSTEAKKKGIVWNVLWKEEDWWAVWLGFFLILLTIIGVLVKPTLPSKWGREPGEGILSSIPLDAIPGILLTGLIVFVIFAAANKIMGRDVGRFATGFPVVFLLAILAYLLGNYAPLRHYGFNEVIWALVLGLLISNTIRTPAFMQKAVLTEMYIKTGLVLLGASILFDRMLVLGMYGLGVAWAVTPVVVIFMYWFSQKILKMHENRGLAITISASTSVCGVSAAIAAGTAAKAKKEEITLAISITLIFTVLMMIGMPAFIALVGIDPIVGGAWIGGTIDSTGAVVAAGAMLGPEAMETAAVIKMIQNILIGVIAFCVAVFWVIVYEKGTASGAAIQSGPKEIWVRMPKFIIGFVAASLVFSFLIPGTAVDEHLGVIKGYRVLFFVLAFVSIGLESNFKDMAKMVRGGKPLILYIIGQSFNLILTLIAAWIFFSGRFFPPVF